MKSFLLILSVATLLLLAGSPPAQAQAKPSSVLDFELWFNEWLEGRIGFAAIVDPARELPTAAKQEKSSGIRLRLKKAFRGQEDKLLVFSSKVSMRDETLTLLKELGFPFTRSELVSFLPKAGDIDSFDLQLLQQVELTSFAKSYWSEVCSRRVLEVLKEGRTMGRPESFLALCFLGLQATGGDLRTQLVREIQRAYLTGEKPLSETTLVTLHRALAHRRWTPDGRDATADAIKETASDTRRGLARQLMNLSIEEFLPTEDLQPNGDSKLRKKQLTAQEFKALAAYVSDWTQWTARHGTAERSVSGWEGWTLKLALQAKQSRDRNARVGQFLADVVAEEGRHCRLFDQSGRQPDNGLVSRDLDIPYFVWLHGTAESPGAWDVMTRSPPNLDKTIALMHRFFAPQRHDRWPVKLLDLLRARYYDRDAAAFLAQLRVISRGVSVPSSNVLRRRLLQGIHDGEFPVDWDQRWTLAYDAADGAKLLDQIPLEKQTCSALELLVTVCLQQPLDANSVIALRQVNQTYGQLLLRIHRAIFSNPQEATLDDEEGEHIMEQLGRLFARLAEHRGKYGWRAEQLDGVNGFYDKVHNTFEEAARSKDRPRMALAIVLLLRIAGLLGEPDQVAELARYVAREMFDIRQEAGRRVISREIAKRDAALFRQIAPAIVDAIKAVARESEFEQRTKSDLLDRLIRLFEDNVYLPLLRSTYFLDEVDVEPDCPWIALAELYSTQTKRKTALRRLPWELNRTEFLSSHQGTLLLLQELSKEKNLDIRVWRNPLLLGGNITVPVLKALLDAQCADMLHPDAQVGVIVRLILGQHEASNLWLLEATYTTRGFTQVQILDPRELLPWHEGMVTLYESRAAPYERMDGTAQELTYSYDARRGPRYELPDGKYSRTHVPGALRLELIDRMTELAQRTAAPLDWQLDVSRLALLLPNRSRQISEGEVLATYTARKEKLIAKWESVLQGAALASGDLPHAALPGKELETEILRFLVRLRFSFFPPSQEPADSATAPARRRLKNDPQRQDDYRALVREEAFLKYINGWNRSGSDVDAQAQTLLDYARSASTAIADAARESSATGTLNRLQHAASYSRQLFGRLEDSDLVLFAPLFDILEDGDVSSKTSYNVLVATALMLPWFGVSSEQFILPEKSDDDGNWSDAPASIDGDALIRRLIFFSLLSGEVRRRLVEHAVEPDGLDDPYDVLVLRRLLIDANTIGTLLAGQVFRNRTLLKEVQRDRELAYDTINFEILYYHSQIVTVNARDLLDSAVKGCQLNFQLFQRTPQETLSDERVLDFLVPLLPAPAKKDATKESIAERLKRSTLRRSFRPLDDVLRTLVTIHHDDRYREDQDEEVRQAAERFQKAAGDFVAKPTHGLIWFQKDASGFQAPETYFRAADAVIRNIVARPLKIVVPSASNDGSTEVPPWLDAAEDDYERLWANLLFGNADPAEVSWQRPFIDRFCAVGAVSDETESQATDVPPAEAGQSPGAGTLTLAQRLRRQRVLVFKLLLGENAADSSERPLDGIAKNLGRLKSVAVGDRGHQFRQRYWESSRSVIRAALVGKGATVSEPVFPARPFVSAMTREIQPIAESQFVDELQGRGDRLLFDALEFPRLFMARCNDGQLADLLGPDYLEFTARGNQPGLGKPSVPIDGEPLGYQHAAWASFTQYVSLTASGWYKQVMEAHGTLQDSNSLAQQVRYAHQSAQANLEAMSSAIAFRLLHNRRIECLADRAEDTRDQSTTGASAIDDYRWLQIDNDTVGWMVGDARLPLLTAVWAPYQLYAFKDRTEVFSRVNEPLMLQMTSANWSRDHLDETQARFWITYLLSCQGVRKGTATESLLMRKSTYDGFEAAADVFDSFRDSDCLCSSGQRETLRPPTATRNVALATRAMRDWSGMKFWKALSELAERRDDERLPGLDYGFAKIHGPKLAALEQKDDLHALPQAILEQVSFTLTSDLRADVGNYCRKMQLIVDAARICPQFVNHKTDESAIIGFLDAAGRLDPVASPFVPEIRRGRVEFSVLGSPFEGWARNNNAADEEKTDSRRLAEILMPRMMLLQWRWSESGLRIHEASHTELVHRLEDLQNN